MYKVEVYHYRETFVRGDLEDETVLIKSELFKTRKSAKEYIEDQVRGKSGVTKSYHKGNETSYVWYHTGHKWINENTGETCHECYTYTLDKVKPK
jgi:hypothetical protein